MRQGHHGSVPPIRYGPGAFLGDLITVEFEVDTLLICWRCAIIVRLQLASKRSPTWLKAWGARNLLELRVITAYVLRSEADALAFKDDFAADLKEFWEAVSKSSEITHRKLVAEMR